MSELSDTSSAVHGPLGHEERDISIRPSSWHTKLLSNFSKDVDSECFESSDFWRVVTLLFPYGKNC